MRAHCPLRVCFLWAFLDPDDLSFVAPFDLLSNRTRFSYLLPVDDDEEEEEHKAQVKT